MIVALIICIVLIGFLGIKLYQKQQINKSELERYNKEIENAKATIDFKTKEVNAQLERLQDLEIECSDARNERICEETRTQSLKEVADEALARYHDIVDIKMKELDTSIEEQRQRRQADLDKTLEETKQKYQLIVEAVERDCQNKTEKYFQEVDEQKAITDNAITYYKTVTDELKAQYEALLAPIKQYEKEKQERLFYTIQLPEEYREDIELLLTTVAAKVQHPDIISKLVWAEYVKPNLDETFKRVEIRAEPGIYKITNIDSGKAYIGKSTNVKTRIADHFKSSVGITSIADQAVHHAIRKEGFWNWSIEVIQYCEKEKLAELEKYYIDFFKTQEFGYNKNSGGGG